MVLIQKSAHVAHYRIEVEACILCFTILLHFLTLRYVGKNTLIFWPVCANVMAIETPRSISIFFTVLPRFEFWENIFSKYIEIMAI